MQYRSPLGNRLIDAHGLLEVQGQWQRCISHSMRHLPLSLHDALFTTSAKEQRLPGRFHVERQLCNVANSRMALKSKTVSMLGKLANYFLGGDISGAQDAREESNNETPESLPVMSRLSQVEVEGDGWILIDRIVEGAATLEESWYVTPPACFTRAGPVNVETSPLENLLIEHPSMSVYRATAFLVAPDTPPPTPDAPEDRDAEDVVLPPVVSGAQAAASAEHTQVTSPVNDREVRRPSIHDGRPTVSRARTEKRTDQSRSAQKVLEKRSTQSWKRGRLERSNKLTEVFSVKGRRPRRQDRLRVQNSGANNNRKC
ncbi:uncharacterized protein LOC122402970 [Colletes gigas]|uniref:uncharacterized protein LOC122402970 n=1 Tax=Colletes gigas TaxID=935657 RepID=UPI001C9A4530|nr:uncharacterized protein LOC122402970 [Colletes gigas]